VFISHSILGREFDEGDVEQATRLGGVFIFDNQNWLLSEEELPAEKAAHELRAYQASLVTIIEDGDYDHIGQSLIALTFTIPDFAEKYGFELTDDAEDWMIDAALEFAEPDSFEVSASLNSMFGEILSWAKLPDTKKETVFEFLSLGFNYKDSKLRSDSIHFLGCMALHESTPNSILEKLAKLKPVFAANGCITAGNSSQTSDGAAFVLIVSETMLKQLNVQPIARLVSYGVAGVPPRIMGIGPVEAIPLALKNAGMKQDQLDLIELNEAFASQSLAIINKLGLNKDMVNVNGGAIALGHPLGCTGAKLTVQILNELKRQNKKYGMVTMCVGTGQGAAGIFELL
jgi:hypothetical protein